MKQQQQQQQKLSLALELNKYLSHWKALGLFSKYVHQNAGSWGRRASGCCFLLMLFGFEVLQEAFSRARGSFFGGVGWGGDDGGVVCLLFLRFYTVSLRLFPAIDE